VSVTVAPVDMLILMENVSCVMDLVLKVSSDDCRHFCTVRPRLVTFNLLITTIKPQSNRSSYSNTVIGTLAVDGWTVTSRRGLGGAPARQGPSLLYQM